VHAPRGTLGDECGEDGRRHGGEGDRLAREVLLERGDVAVVAVDRLPVDPTLGGEVVEEPGELARERSGGTARPSASLEPRHDETDHLLDGTPQLTSELLLPRPGPSFLPDEARASVDEGVDMVRQVVPALGTALLSERAEVHEQRDP